MMDKQRIRVFMFYEWLHESRVSKGAANANDDCRESVVSKRTIRRWLNRFDAGVTSLEVDKRSG